MVAYSRYFSCLVGILRKIVADEIDITTFFSTYDGRYFKCMHLRNKDDAQNFGLTKNFPFSIQILPTKMKILLGRRQVQS